MDAELCRDVDQWNETLRTDLMKLCKEHNFNPGFWEGNDNSSVVDAYELKVLIHVFSSSSSYSSGRKLKLVTMFWLFKGEA